MLPALRPLFASLPNEIVRSLIPDLTFLFDSWATSGSSEYPAYSSTPAPSTTANSQSSGSAGSLIGQNPPSSNGGKKRTLSHGGEPPGDSDEDRGNLKRPKLHAKCQGGLVRKWACPYYQRMPHYYCVETEYGDFRKCARSPGFSEVHRVKYVWLTPDLFISNKVPGIIYIVAMLLYTATVVTLSSRRKTN